MTRFPNGGIPVRAGFSCFALLLSVSLSLSVCHSELLFLPASETIAVVVVDESCTYGVG